MRKLFSLLCITFAVFMTFSLCADADETKPYKFEIYESSYESSLSADLNEIPQWYNFDRIEGYFDELYVGRYKNWENYLVGKQREVAGKFGLTDIFFRPNFRRYDNTKIALSKSIWRDRLLFRYLAPVGDVRDFDMSVAFRPYHFMTFIMRGQMSGEQQVALVVSQPLGRGNNTGETQRLKWLLGQAKRLAD
ncbi:hypothetical protein ACFL6S_03230 [Candidatus Poribacteria bacterium]